MKKAAAIVTEQGGITCHAAIVSRELGIPCVIGTKIATKVLKDDDFVEVDANKGIVRKLNMRNEVESAEVRTESRERSYFFGKDGGGIKLIIFDFNGVATKGGYAKTIPILAKRYNIPKQELYDVFYTKYLNLGATNQISEDDVWRLPVKHFGIRDGWREIRKFHWDLQTPNSPVVNLANKLRENYKVIILTKNISGQLDYIVKQTKIDKYFDEIINTQKLNLPKASHQTMLYIMEKFNINPQEIVYIDDQENNLEEPKKMGVKTILYRNFQQFKRELNKYLYSK